MSRFDLAGDSHSLSSIDDEDNLPYPEALPRADFLASEFDAPTYLSTLADRHQTLEDLRTDLRERSQLLSRELLDLINSNYEQFLSLGSDLKGGEEKVEDVRVGLLGFRKGVDEIRSKVELRGKECGKLLEVKGEVTRQTAVARKLLEIDGRLEELEERLMIVSLSEGVSNKSRDGWSDSETEDDEEQSDDRIEGSGMSAHKLYKLVEDYRLIVSMSATVGTNHPFIIGQEARMTRVRGTLLLDLSTALKAARTAGIAGHGTLMKIMGIYREMDESVEAVKILQALRVTTK